MEEVKELSWWGKKRENHRKKVRRRIEDSIYNDKDIKYRGPLSYRYLRIIGWVCMALGQLTTVAMLYLNIGDKILFNDAGDNLITIIGALATPLFLIANFGLVFNHKRTYKQSLMSFGGLFLAIGLGLILVYYHYIDGLLSHLNVSTETRNSVSAITAQKAQINIFADLFAAALFNFFLNYTPKKHFKGKKIAYFRLLSLLPVLYIVVCYIIKTYDNFYYLESLATSETGNGKHIIPFGVMVFLTTKNPFVHLIFIVIAIWIKNREKYFVKLGYTKEDYKKYLSTNRNSLSFAIHISVLCLIVSLLDWVIYIVCYSIDLYSGAVALVYYALLGGLQCAALIFVIPFIMLFSYTRTHENKLIDLFVPIIGIAMVAFVYSESMYQLIVQLSSGS